MSRDYQKLVPFRNVSQWWAPALFWIDGGKSGIDERPFGGLVEVWSMSLSEPTWRTVSVVQGTYYNGPLFNIHADENGFRLFIYV